MEPGSSLQCSKDSVTGPYL